MVSLLYCEFLKLKRSKMFVISILGALVPPSMVFVGLLKMKYNDPNKVITFKDMFSETNLYVLLLFGVIVYVVIAAYLFSREYTENTLKNILSIPVSKMKFIISKYIMLLIWVWILTAITFIATFTLSYLGGAEKLSMGVVIKYLTQYYVGGTLLYLTLTPFVFITLMFKNIVPTIISAASVTMVNVALSNEDLTAIFPWSAVHVIASEQVILEYSLIYSYVSIFILSAIGFVASIVYFKKQDVK